MMRRWWVLLLFPFISLGQDFSKIAEDLEYSLAEEIELDETEMGIHWDLNKIDEQGLKSLGLLTSEQIQNFLHYRRLLGPFIAKEELRAVPGFDEEIVKKMWDWIDLANSTVVNGKPERTFFTRWNTSLPLKNEYKNPASYLGSPHYLGHHFRFKIPGKWSAGLGIEKDAGEKFGDSWNFHLSGNQLSKKIKSLLVGDFMVQMGQGLITRGGFGGSFSLNPALILKTGSVFRPVNGLSEGFFQRGAGITLAFNPNWEISFFGSVRQRDSNRLFSSLGTSGLHRTASEIEYKNSVRHLSTGFEIKRLLENGHIAWKGLYHHLNIPLNPVKRPYSQYRFSGSSLFNGSIDFSYLWAGVRWTGEWAFDASFTSAWISTLHFSPDKKLDLALSVRNYGIAFKSLESNGFGKSSGTQNERGIFLLAVLKPIKNLEISGMFDQRLHPWLRFNSYSPSVGQSARLRASWSKRKFISAYLEYFMEKSEQNSDQILEGINLTRFRFSASLPVSKNLEWRSRFDYAFLNGQKGSLIYQDLIINPTKIPFDFKIRWAIVDTYGYDMRFYAYENHLTNTFSMPAYFGTGHRWYVLSRFKTNHFTFEFKTAYTFKPTKISLGSPAKWDIFGQFIYRW